MVCPFCNHKKTLVTNSRPRKTQSEVWRRRCCTSCSRVFTTHEQPSISEHTRVKTSDGYEPFSIGKLSISIAKCFAHDTKFGDMTAYWLARTIESQLLVALAADRMLTTSMIGRAALNTLQRFDRDAAIQYAARYGMLDIISSNDR